MSSEILLKTTKSNDIGRPEGGGDILHCQQNSVVLLLLLFLVMKKVCGRDLAVGNLHNSFSCFIMCPGPMKDSAEHTLLSFHVTQGFCSFLIYNISKAPTYYSNFPCRQCSTNKCALIPVSHDRSSSKVCRCMSTLL